jgi:NTP pyrophosphatase (non-canonical NTP hydrolase)
MTRTQHPSHDADMAHELQEIGEEFGCQRLQGEGTHAYALRLLAYVGEMASEMRAVESHVRDLVTSAEQSQ